MVSYNSTVLSAMLINILIDFKEQSALKYPTFHSFIHSDGLILAVLMPSDRIRRIVGHLPPRKKNHVLQDASRQESDSKCSILAVTAMRGTGQRSQVLY